MIYPDTFEQKTGFRAVRQHIGELCTTAAGRRETDDMSFLTDFGAVEAALRAVDEMTRATEADCGFALGPVADFGEPRARAKAVGAFLSAAEFVQVARTLATTAQVWAFFHREGKEDGEKDLFPHLSERAATLNPLPELARAIERVIDQYGKVRDNASPELASIRA